MKHKVDEVLANGGTVKVDYHTLILTDEERGELEPFLKSLGIELRLCMWHGGIGEYQARNAYRTELQFLDKERYERVGKDIEQGWWRR